MSGRLLHADFSRKGDVVIVRSCETGILFSKCYSSRTLLFISRAEVFSRHSGLVRAVIVAVQIEYLTEKENEVNG